MGKMGGRRKKRWQKTKESALSVAFFVSSKDPKVAYSETKPHGRRGTDDTGQIRPFRPLLVSFSRVRARCCVLRKRCSFVPTVGIPFAAQALCLAREPITVFFCREATCSYERSTRRGHRLNSCACLCLLSRSVHPSPGRWQRACPGIIPRHSGRSENVHDP